MSSGVTETLGEILQTIQKILQHGEALGTYIQSLFPFLLIKKFYDRQFEEFELVTKW